ncbi:DNA helicase UvrD [Candidatus Uhrbacteria bacterium]|nr:DNA helicase UvrD [Candidatus Uhrbacteria bacterium]
MRIIADLHIHSRYSRACSKDLTLPNIALWCRKKGIGLVGTGDFTHPAWFASMEKELEPHESGFYKLTTDNLQLTTFFVPTAEISCIYSRGGKVRRVHTIVVAPTLAVVKKINTRLAAIGNIHSDGRPILGLDVEELAKIIFDASPECLVIPAHAWTPWFAVFGSQSGFNSLEECFGGMTKHIYAIETGLSSDPKMNWRLSQLDRITLISNSDAHSLPNLGREANVLDLPKPSYATFVDAIRKKDPARFLYTIEFFPEEGKYHVDGHRVCGVRLTPAETKKHNGRCPKCKKPVTVGVLYRIDALANRKEGERPANAIPYKSIVPLQEIIAETLDVGKQSKRVQATYEKIVTRGKSEFALLLDVPYDALENLVGDPRIVEGIRRVREGALTILPGYDGEYGTIRIFTDAERVKNKQQKLL